MSQQTKDVAAFDFTDGMSVRGPQPGLNTKDFAHVIFDEGRADVIDYAHRSRESALRCLDRLSIEANPYEADSADLTVVDFQLWDVPVGRPKDYPHNKSTVVFAETPKGFDCQSFRIRVPSQLFEGLEDRDRAERLGEITAIAGPPAQFTVVGFPRSHNPPIGHVGYNWEQGMARMERTNNRIPDLPADAVFDYLAVLKREVDDRL